MAAVKEHVLLRQPDKLVALAEVPASGPRDAQPTATLRLLVELCSDHGAGPADVDTMEDVASRMPLAELGGCQGAAERAFKDLVARIDNPVLRPEVAAQTAAAAKQVRARCGAGLDELRGVEFRLRVVFVDDAPVEEEEEEDESGSDMEFGEFDLSGARSLRGQQTDAGYGYDCDYEEDDEDEDGCGAQFTVRPYRGALAPEGGGAPSSSSSLLLSGFAARSDGPELTEEHELTSYDMQRVVRRALGGGGGSVEDDEAYLRALDGAAPVSPASRAAMVDQALQATRQQQQQQQQQQRSKSRSPIFPMRTGF